MEGVGGVGLKACRLGQRVDPALTALAGEIRIPATSPGDNGTAYVEWSEGEELVLRQSLGQRDRHIVAREGYCAGHEGGTRKVTTNSTGGEGLYSAVGVSNKCVSDDAHAGG